MRAFGAARSEAIDWAVETVERGDVLYLDTETTGLGDTDELVDIAVIDNRGRTLLNTLIKPRRPIPADATAVHGISNLSVRHAPVWAEVYPRFLELMSGYQHVIVYNADFDQRLIRQTCYACALILPHVNWHCAMKKYAAFVGVRGSYGDYRWHQLRQAVSQLGINLIPDHSALTDAQACRAVVQAMAAAA